MSTPTPSRLHLGGRGRFGRTSFEISPALPSNGGRRRGSHLGIYLSVDLRQDRPHEPTRRQRTSRQSRCPARRQRVSDRKSTRLNSSHRCISYAVFCLKKKKKNKKI